MENVQRLKDALMEGIQIYLTDHVHEVDAADSCFRKNLYLEKEELKQMLFFVTIKSNYLG